MAQQSYKKFVASAATATLVASALVPVASAANVTTSAFTDVPASYKEAVEFVVTNNIASGLTATQFGISQQIKRGDVAIMIAAAAGLNDEKAPAAGFSDVPKRGALAINSLKAAGVISGKTTTKFGFEDNVTRGEAALMLQKAFDLKAGGTTNSFTDVSSRYDAAVDALVANKVTSGINATQFGTVNNIKRGDFAKFLFALKDQIKVGVPVEAVAVQDATTLKVTVKDADKELVAKDFKVSVDGSAVEVSKAVADADGKNYTLTIPTLDGKKGIVTVNGVQADFNFGPGVAPQVLGVTATSATKATVTFADTLPKEIDFSNFEINGGMVVTNAKVSADRKSVELTVNKDFTRNQEYTLTVTGVKDADGKVYPDSTGKFTWEVAEGVSVALGATTLEQGEVTGLTVKDAAGKDVKDATVEVTSFNTNVLAATTATGAPNAIKLTAGTVAGTTDVQVVTTLADGTVLTNTFKVTVKEAVTTIANKGYTLLASAPTPADYQYDNTTAFAKFGKANTNVEVGDTKNLVAFTETNSNPDAAPIDFTGATVKTSNGVVATAVVAGANIEVTGNAVGTATLTVTLNDAAKTKKTFAVNVTAEPKLTEVLVDATSVKLSDETAGGTEGVTEQTVTVNSIDQFKDAINFGSTGKVTVATSTSGLVLGGTLSADSVTGLTNKLTFAADEATFTIGSTANTPITNGKVTVSYFAKATDTKPTATKVITVNVVDVDATVTASDIDVVVPATEIDANAKNTATSADYDSIDFTASKAFSLDSKGNRIGTTTISGATLATTSVNDKFVGINTNELIFSLDGGATDNTADVLTYGRNIANTVNVNVSNGAVTKTVAVKYKNSAVLPNKATVATTPVSIKVPTATAVTLEDIIFGSVDVANADGQLLTDTVNSVADSVYAIAKTAKNSGYEYNKPVVSLTGTDGKAFNIGTGLYGSTLTELSTSANMWTNAFEQGLQTTKFKVDGFDVDFAITNIVKTTGATIVNNNDLADNVTLAANTDYATFTLVVKGIYIENAPQATTEEKAANNLLASPVQVNVNVSSK